MGTQQPGVSFDCSGLVQWAWAQQGVNIPRSTTTMWASPQITIVDLSQIQPGDILFVNNQVRTDTQPDHVAMYIGNNKIVEASGQDVHINTMISQGSNDNPPS